MEIWKYDIHGINGSWTGLCMGRMLESKSEGTNETIYNHLHAWSVHRGQSQITFTSIIVWSSNEKFVRQHWSSFVFRNKIRAVEYFRVVHGSDGPAGRVRSRFCRILAGRVGSGQHFGFISFLLIISWYLNRYESSNTTFGLIDFHRYLIYNYI